jgi:hypothetical protein
MKILLTFLLLSAGAGAHELQDNRATLVLRDNTHLSITLYIAYGDALHLALAPQRPLQEFLVMYSAMKPELLQKELLRAQAQFQYLSMGRELPVTNWVWPDAKQVQSLLQRRIMAAMVDPAGHAHEEPVEIHADANSQQEILTVRAQFPEAFARVLLVAFRPSQLWVEPKSLSSPVKF